MSRIARTGGRLTRVELIICIAFAGIGVAIFAPKLMRADAASDEAQAIADLRTVSSAEQAYAAANFGYFSDVVNLCRSGPECRGIGIPGYPDDAPEFISPELGRQSPYLKDGYEHTFTQGQRPRSLPPGADPKSLLDFCYEARPYAPGPDGFSRTFTIDGSGRIFLDSWGAAIPCPIDYGTKLLEEPRPALAVDFGRRGLWQYDGENRWIRLARANPSLVRAWDDSILASFENRRGLYHLDASGWRRIHTRTPTDVVSLVGGVAAQFPRLAGLWYWDGRSWSQISPWEPEAIEVQGTRLFIDFGPNGLWLFWQPLGLVQLSEHDPVFLFAGRFHLDANLADGRKAQNSFIENVQELELYWTPTSAPSPETELEFDGVPYGFNSAWDYGATGGLWFHSWFTSGQVSLDDPQLLTHLDGELVAAFEADGLLRLSGGTQWTTLTSWAPMDIATADTYLGALGDDGRIHRVDASSTSMLTRWRAESVTAIDLTAASHGWQLRPARRCPVPQRARLDDSCRRLARIGGQPSP